MQTSGPDGDILLDDYHHQEHECSYEADPGVVHECWFETQDICGYTIDSDNDYVQWQRMGGGTVGPDHTTGLPIGKIILF